MIPSHDILERLFSLVSDFVYVYRIEPSGEPVFEWGSDSLFKMNGYSNEDLRNNPFPWAHPDDAEEWQSIGAHLVAGERVEGELRGIKKNGDLYWARFCSQPLWDESQNRVTRVIGAATDITTEKHEIARRQEAQALLWGIVDNSSLVIYAKNPEGQYLLVNSEFERLFDVNHADILGKTDFEIFTREEAETFRTNDQRALAAGTSIQQEETVSVDHESKSYIATKFPLRGPDGSVFAVCGISTEITRLKAAETEVLHKERDIRQAYIDVIAAVTGNKLILLNPHEIEAVLGRPITPIHEIKEFSQLAGAREFVRQSLAALYPDRDNLSEIVVAVGEALTNAVKHGGGGHCWISATEEVLQIAIADLGPGIDFKMLPKATLLAGYSTAGSLGMGFTIMLDASDRLLVSTEPGETIVVIELRTAKAHKLAPVMERLEV